jgi:hypothetical protein
MRRDIAQNSHTQLRLLLLGVPFGMVAEGIELMKPKDEDYGSLPRTTTRQAKEPGAWKVRYEQTNKTALPMRTAFPSAPPIY